MRRMRRAGPSQEQRRTERNEPIEVPERPVGHQEVDPPIEEEALGEEVADADRVGPRHLEFKAFEADRASHILDVKQDGWKIGRVERGHGPRTVGPKERVTDVLTGPPVEMPSAPSQEPTDLRL